MWAKISSRSKYKATQSSEPKLSQLLILFSFSLSLSLTSWQAVGIYAERNMHQLTKNKFKNKKNGTKRVWMLAFPLSRPNHDTHTFSNYQPKKKCMARKLWFILRNSIVIFDSNLNSIECHMKSKKKNLKFKF